MNDNAPSNQVASENVNGAVPSAEDLRKREEFLQEVRRIQGQATPAEAPTQA